MRTVRERIQRLLRRRGLLLAAGEEHDSAEPEQLEPQGLFSAWPTRAAAQSLLRRVFAIDVLTCPSCGSRRRLIALITDPPVLRKILRHLGLPAEPPALP